MQRLRWPTVSTARCSALLRMSTSAPPAQPDASAAGTPGTVHSDSQGDDEARRQEVRDALIQMILSRDKELFELKRQHELSMLRVEQNQRRILKDQEDRGMYYEQNCNVHTFDTVSTGLYSQRSTLYHTMGVERLRNVKLVLVLAATAATWVFLYYRYCVNPDWEYVERPIKLIGSRAGALKNIRIEKEDNEYFSQQSVQQ